MPHHHLVAPRLTVENTKVTNSSEFATQEPAVIRTQYPTPGKYAVISYIFELLSLAAPDPTAIASTLETRYPVPPCVSLNRQSDCAVSDDLTLVASLNSTPSLPEIAMS